MIDKDKKILIVGLGLIGGSYAKKLVEDCELEIFKDYFLKDETADGCAALMGYGCG